MKVKYDIVNARRSSIAKYIRDHEDISTNKLIEHFNVSDVTIRRDLTFLEENGFIERYYGGARIITNPLSTSNTPYKRLIAQKAASLIKDGDIIYINSSSTALLIIEYIKNKHVVIITNNAKALFIDHDPNISIFFLGGEIRFPKEVMVGDFALNNLNTTIADKAFLGCSGISTEIGISTAVVSEVAINQKMIEKTKDKVYMLADHTKVGNNHSFCTGPINCIDCLITDSYTDDTFCNKVREQNVEVIKVEALNLNI